jgi:ATP-dependent RNA helicase DOB1
LRRSGKMPGLIGSSKANRSSKETDVYEGSLVRLFRRLEELLRQLAQACRVIGNAELEVKFESSLTMVKKDVVAAQSLYL